jgi:hypothetical protein
VRDIIKNKKAFVITILFLALFITYGATMLEAGSCEKAFELCMNTFISSVYGMNFIYCGTGYLFCIKYIEK